MWLISPGDLIDRRYRVERELGAGGMAHVYAAKDEELGELVALKVIRPELVSDLDLVERFKREVRIARQIHHPNVVRILEYGRAELGGKELYYMTMELLSGVDLKKRRARSIGEILDFGIQIADGLDAAHREGVVHRDIKPQNVFIDETGRARVMDFGISRLAALTGLTRGSQSVGTPHYMSPEQVTGKKDLDHRSDIYSVGVLLYELATGRVPFDGKTPVEVALRHLQEAPAAPRRLNPSLPKELETVILTCMEKDPDRRYRSAAELRGALERLSQDFEQETIQTGIPSPPPPTAEVPVIGEGGRPETKGAHPQELVTTRRARAPKNKLPVLWLAAAGAVLVLGIAGFFGLRSKPPPVVPNEEPGLLPLPPPPAALTTSAIPARPPAPVAQPVTPPAPPPPRDAAAPAVVRISANPGTEIRVDGTLAGTVPPIVELSLPAGRHRIGYRIPDYDEFEEEVEVRSGALNSFSHQFPPYGVLRVVAQPYARAHLDGRDLGFTPVNLPKVRQGEYRLVLEREGYETIEKTIEVKPGELNRYQFELKR